MSSSAHSPLPELWPELAGQFGRNSEGSELLPVHSVNEACSYFEWRVPPRSFLMSLCLLCNTPTYWCWHRPKSCLNYRLYSLSHRYYWLEGQYAILRANRMKKRLRKLLSRISYLVVRLDFQSNAKSTHSCIYFSSSFLEATKHFMLFAVLGEGFTEC